VSLGILGLNEDFVQLNEITKLGETSKNLSKIFKKASLDDCIIFLDEFDSLGKIRDYSQDHGEMKRVVNTILQLFDYLPQSSIVIAATNQKEMIDEALLRRFDNIITFSLPTEKEIKELIDLTLKDGQFKLKINLLLISLLKIVKVCLITVFKKH
jgi:SpoVK/Ycf46/Vps4 family AAA+-type ATPase